MDSKIITVRFNEFDQEYLDLAKQIMAEDKDFYNIDNSFVIKMAIHKYIGTKILSNDELKDKYFNTWHDLDSRYTKYLLNN